MLGTKLHLESERRKKQWEALLAAGGPKSIAPKTLNDLAIYRGGRGVWFDKNTTRDLSDDGTGVAVGVLHTGSSYADDLTDDGVIYHYPSTERAGRDDAEIAALRNALRLGLPVCVVTHSPSKASRRDVHRGWVTDTDDLSALCLIEFGGEPRPAVPIATTAFRLEANREERKQLTKRLKRSARFSFEVGKRCGWRCAVCAIEIQELRQRSRGKGIG
jgi:putative restriction endonuclease